MPSPVINKAITLDFKGMTIPALKTELLRLADVLDLANSQRRTIFQMIADRRAEASARQRVGNLNDVEKDALLRVLQER